MGHDGLLQLAAATRRAGYDERAREYEALAAELGPPPDADLIRACARYLELERVINDPARDRHVEAGDMPEWAEYEAIEEVLVVAQPSTWAGAVALARVALDCAEGKDQGWEAGGTHTSITHNLSRWIGGAA